MKGRPVRLAFSGLFLPSVEWEMKAQETPLRRLEDDPSFGTLARSVRRNELSERNLHHLEPIRNRLASMRDDPRAADFLAALDGCQQAGARLHATGEWATFALGLRDRGDVVFEEYVRLEALSEAANKAVGSNDFQRAATCVRDSPELRVFWRHGALDRLADAESADVSFVPRLVAYLEVQMSCLAKFSLSGGKAAMAQAVAGPFEQLLHSRPASPGGQWIRSLQRFAGTRSMAELLNLAAGHGLPGNGLPSEATFKRWCSGAVFPSEKCAMLLLDAVARGGGSAVRVETISRAFESEFAFARKLNYALRFACLIAEHTVARQGLNPHLNAESPIAWAQASFRHWVGHWRHEGTSGFVTSDA